MMISIQYTDGRHDMVKPQVLDRLLDSQKLSGFRRREGWVRIGRDPLRRRPGPRVEDFSGQDRRAAVN